MHGSPKPGKAIEFKSASLSVVTTFVRDVDPARLEEAIQAILGGVPDFFGGEPTVIDFGQLASTPSAVEWAEVVRLLRRYLLQPMAVRHLDASLAESARRAGLAILDEDETPVRRRIEQLNEKKGAPPPPAPPSEAAAPASPAARTLVVERTLRSGQQVYARGCDLVVVGSVSNGAELIADGNIHCYGPLRGRAVAGARGDTSAQIFTSAMNAELVSIAGVYRTFENGLPDNLTGRPARVGLSGHGAAGEPPQLTIAALSG